MKANFSVLAGWVERDCGVQLAGLVIFAIESVNAKPKLFALVVFGSFFLFVEMLEWKKKEPGEGAAPTGKETRTESNHICIRIDCKLITFGPSFSSTEQLGEHQKRADERRVV